MGDWTDKKFAYGLRKRDEASQTAFYKKHYKRLFDYVRSQIAIDRNFEDSEEITNDAFVRAFRYPPPNSDNLDYWIITCAKTSGAAFYRNPDNAYTHVVNAGQFYDTGHNPHECRDQLRDVWGLLKEREQNIFVLAACGYTAGEIGRAIGLSEANVWKIKQRARGRFDKR
jgi:RNA polymerase sigma factor (sigma-70 family)